jgi:hypothetical protein
MFPVAAARTQIDAIIRNQEVDDRNFVPYRMGGVKRLKDMDVQRAAAPTVAGRPLMENDGTPIKTFTTTFTNWGSTVRFKPEIIYQPSSVEGVCNIVKWATRENKKIRVCGYQHSWANLFGDDGCVMISLFSLEEADQLPAGGLPPYDEEGNVFEKISCKEDEDGVYGTVTVGAGVTNYQFQEWAQLREKDPKQNSYYFPFNVVMTEITIGGSNAPMCHGSGIQNATLSDLVTEMTFVNVRGEVQRVVEPDQLRAAAGCFGLLGVVISLTFKLRKTRYATMSPTKPPVTQAIPPPVGYRLPRGMTMPGDADVLWTRFIQLAEQSDYNEWFWFAADDRCWVNCWNAVDNRPENTVDYPTPPEKRLQQLQITFANSVFNSESLNHLPPHCIAKIFSKC